VVTVVPDSHTGGNSVPPEDWSLPLRHEVHTVERSAGIKERSVVVERGEDGAISICFTVLTDELIEPQPTVILDEEPVRLLYRTEGSVGRLAPKAQSLRPDFPKDLPHLNPTPPEGLPDLCLARAGLQAIYERSGVGGVVRRLCKWLRDAKTGSLLAQGWELVPRFSSRRPIIGLLHAAAFQELAASQGEKMGHAAGVTRVERIGANIQMALFPQSLSATEPAGRSALKAALLDLDRALHDQGMRQLPWVFAWAAHSKPINAPLFGDWQSLAEIREGMEAVGLAAEIDCAVTEVILLGECPDTFEDKRAFALLLGVWRPAPIDPAVYGLSADTDARALEIRTYQISYRPEVNPVASPELTEATEVMPMSFPNPDLLRFVSNVRNGASVCLFGYGALGSEIGTILLRAGIQEIGVVDNDVLLPHNLARHESIGRGSGENKATLLAGLAKKIGILDFCEVDGRDRDILDFDEKELTSLLQGREVLIDATASESVRIHLSTTKYPEELRVIRVEIFNYGRLGVQFVSGLSGNPSLLDLYYTLCLHAPENDAIYSWICAEESADIAFDELVIGFGCSSVTVRLPKYVISQHVTAFCPSIFASIEGAAESGVGINPLTRKYTPSGWQWFPVSSFVEFDDARTNGWKVRISQDAYERINKERIIRFPNETGGYLYGGLDLISKQLSVTWASLEPPRTVGHRGRLELGRAGTTDEEDWLIRRCRGKLAVIGTWHSHPTGSAAMSQRDADTVSGFARDNFGAGLPTLLVITSPDDTVAYVPEGAMVGNDA